MIFSFFPRFIQQVFAPILLVAFRNANLSIFGVDFPHVFQWKMNITHHKPWGRMRTAFQNCAKTCFCRKKVEM